MQNHKGKNNTTSFLLTLFSPFAGLVYCLSRWREPWAKNVFWLVCVYLGAIQVYWPEGTVLGIGADGGRYVLELMDMHGSGITLSQILGRYLIDQRTMDLYQPLITYFISRFTDNGHVLFAIYAFVFGFFYSRNIWYILEKLPNKKMGGLAIVVTLYFLVCPITSINGVRMWTATHVFVYGMMPYLLERDRTKIWWVLVTPLIHFSFLYVSIFALVYYFLPYRIKTNNRAVLSGAMLLFLFTLFINTLNLGSVNGILMELSPESYEERIDQYVSQDVLDMRMENKKMNNWYVAASGNIMHWSFCLLLIMAAPCLRRNFKDEKGLYNLCLFALLLGTFANIMALIPSGGRFQVLSNLFKVPLILLVAMSVSKTDNFRKFVNVALIVLLIPLVVETRKFLEYYSITLLFGNFITVFFWENNVPIIDIIKRIF